MTHPRLVLADLEIFADLVMWNDRSLLFEFVFSRVCRRVNIFISVYGPIVFSQFFPPLFFIGLYIIFLGILYIYRSILYVDIYDHIFWIIYILLIVYFVNFLLVYGIFGRVREKRRREKFLVSLFL